MKVVDVISFENISAIDQPILPLSFLKLSLKQLGLLLLTVFVAYSLSSKSIEVAIPIALLLTTITFYKPYGMPFEVIIINILKFMHRKINEGDKKDKVTSKFIVDKNRIRVTSSSKTKFFRSKKEETIEQIKGKEGKGKKLISLSLSSNSLYNDMIFKKKDKKELDITRQPTTAVDTDTVTDADTVPTSTPTTPIPTSIPTGIHNDTILYYIVPDYKTVSINLTDNYTIETDNNTKIVLPSRKDLKIEIVVEDGTIRKIVVH